jgi:hypothetical protein
VVRPEVRAQKEVSCTKIDEKFIDEEPAGSVDAGKIDGTCTITPDKK